MTTDPVTVILEAMERRPLGPSKMEAAQRIAQSLDDLGYRIVRKPKRRGERAVTAPQSSPIDDFRPDTGNPDIDAFLRRKHDPHYKPLSLPKVLDYGTSHLGKMLTRDPLSQNRPRGGDKRPLSMVLAEAEAHAEEFGWPGRYDILGSQA